MAEVAAGKENFRQLVGDEWFERLSLLREADVQAR
jgi:hypothetical protein